LVAIARHSIAPFLALLLCFTQGSARSRPSADDLHAQAVAAVLARDFSSPDISFIFLDGQGRVLARQWDNADDEIAVGSLIKPMIAFAYGRRHAIYPVFRCTGKKTCWLPRGHGTVSIREAIGQSCNSYFRQLAASQPPGFAAPFLREVGLNDDTDGHSGRAAPMALARAYLQLAARSSEAAVRPVIEGMEISARRGTAKEAGMAVSRIAIAAKTGTAPCSHSRKAPGDGFALVMMPPQGPRAVLLVRVHGKPGSAAAETAGRMLVAAENGGQ
jgi:cell division protein FtsI/penicillin-binding protein 2